MAHHVWTKMSSNTTNEPLRITKMCHIQPHMNSISTCSEFLRLIQVGFNIIAVCIAVKYCHLEYIALYFTRCVIVFSHLKSRFFILFPLNPLILYLDPMNLQRMCDETFCMWHFCPVEENPPLQTICHTQPHNSDIATLNH